MKGSISSASSDVLGNRWIKIGMISVIGLLVGSWFLFQAWCQRHKHSIRSSTILTLACFFIPFFILVMLGVFSTSVIDGLDGLAGGVLAIIFAAYAVIAVGQHQIGHCRIMRSDSRRHSGIPVVQYSASTILYGRGLAWSAWLSYWPSSLFLTNTVLAAANHRIAADCDNRLCHYSDC